MHSFPSLQPLQLIMIISAPTLPPLLRRVCFGSAQATLRLPSFHHFPFHGSIFKYLEAQDIHTPTYIQYAFFSALAKEKNKVYHLTAPTGSGKTLTYLLPIISQLKQEEEGVGPLTASQRPRAIVLTATKELVVQGRQVGKQISHHSKLKVEGLGIGRSLKEEKQSIINGVDLLMSTYSRLSMQLRQNNLYTSHLKWIVIDETDTLFETGRIEEVFKEVVNRTKNMPEGPRILLTGTTSSPELKKLLASQFKEYTEVVDNRAHMNLENIKHEFIQCAELDKHNTLLDVLYQRRQAKTLIFCNTVRSLHELEYFLESQGLTVLSLHSQLHKNARLQNYQLFRDGQNSILISTDLGGRGLDIPHLERVINYDFPLSTVDYLQRAGRTGRAGQPGQVVTLYHKKNIKTINQLKDASFDTPLRVSNSAYRMKNREARKEEKKIA